MKNANEAEANRLKNAANEARDKGDWNIAEQKFDAYLKLSPEDAPIWVQLGHARKEIGDLKGAEKAYIRSMSIAPEVADTHVMLGHLRKQMGKLSQAAACYAEAVELEPEALDPRIQLAFAEKDLQHFDAALAHFRILHAMDPGNQEVADLVVSLAELTNAEPVDAADEAAAGDINELRDIIRTLAFEVQSLKGRMNGLTKTLQSFEESMDALQAEVRNNQKASTDRLIQLESQTPNVSQSLQSLMRQLGVDDGAAK